MIKASTEFFCAGFLNCISVLDGFFYFGKLNGHFLLGDQIAAGGKQRGNTRNAGDIAEGIVVAENDLPGDGNDQYLNGICRGHIQQHSHKFQTNYDGQDAVQVCIQ